MGRKTNDDGLQWQVGVWDGMSELYLREIDRRFASVVEEVIARAAPKKGEQVLDLGTGTGAVAFQAVPLVGSGGRVTGIDISADMLGLARRRATERGFDNVEFREGRAEAIPGEDGGFDVVLACLSLMYVIDRAAAAREIARVLRPGGRLVAAVWAGPAECDIVRFQQTAGGFAPPPPVPGVGPGALAHPAEFLQQQSQAGIRAHVERRQLGFDFDDFESAWEVLAGVTTAQLPPERREEAKKAVRALMWPQAGRPRHFRNTTQFLMGRV